MKAYEWTDLGNGTWEYAPVQENPASSQAIARTRYESAVYNELLSGADVAILETTTDQNMRAIDRVVRRMRAAGYLVDMVPGVTLPHIASYRLK